MAIIRSTVTTRMIATALVVVIVVTGQSAACNSEHNFYSSGARALPPLAVSSSLPLGALAETVSVQIVPHSGCIPLGQNVTYTCTTNGTFTNWLVTLPGQSPLPLPSSVMSIVNLLNSNGVFYNATMLRVNGSLLNNGTVIECVAIRDAFTYSDNLVITVYGKLQLATQRR